MSKGSTNLRIEPHNLCWYRFCQSDKNHLKSIWIQQKNEQSKCMELSDKTAFNIGFRVFIHIDLQMKTFLANWMPLG